MKPGEKKKKNGPESESALDAAGLRKLELEIAALERKEKEEESTEPTRQQKLNLELKTLLWQTGRVFKLSQFAIIFSILATVVTVFATTYGIWTSYRKDTEIKAKEIRERTDTLYRAEIQRLIQYPIDPKVTISDAVFLFRDLGDVVKNGYEEGEKQNRQKEEIGLLLSQLINSPDVDLAVTRNVEFDRKAITNSEFYRAYLVGNPKYNRDIISKYKSVLKALHKEDPDYVIQPDEQNQEIFIEINPAGKGTKDQTKFFQYVYIFWAYKAHVELLTETMKNLELAKEARDYYDRSFCWFYGATENIPLTIKIYEGDPGRVAWRWERCIKPKKDG